MQQHRVFFFGAGASKAEGGLLTRQLLSESLTSADVDVRFVSVVKKFLNDLFMVPLNSKRELPEFEELLTLVDMALLKQEGFSGYWNGIQLQELREALIYCIARILKLKIQEKKTKDYHNQFIQTLFKNSGDPTEGETRPDENAFISLNYDILLDSALVNLYPTWHIDYGIDFRDFHSPAPQKLIKLFKLHGSLNWAFCPVCNSMSLRLGDKVVDRIIAEGIPCEEDNTIQRPLIIPPTWLKVYDNAHITKIWLEAEHTLRNANAIFFIGYSLPESDVHVRYLLKKALYRLGMPPKIIVITSKKKRTKSAVQLRSRYRRFLGSVKFHHIGFEKFSIEVADYIT